MYSTTNAKLSVNSHLRRFAREISCPGKETVTTEKEKNMKTKLNHYRTVLALLVAALVTVLATPNASAQNCIGGGMASVLQVTPGTAHVGDTITITALGVGVVGNVCSVDRGESYLIYPDGVSTPIFAHQYQTNYTLTSGTLRQQKFC